MTAPTQNRALDGIFSKRPEEREIEERFLQRMTAAHLEQRKGIVHLAEALMSGKFDSVLQPLASKEAEVATERFCELEAFSLSGRRRKPQ